MRAAVASVSRFLLLSFSSLGEKLAVFSLKEEDFSSPSTHTLSSNL